MAAKAEDGCRRCKAAVKRDRGQSLRQKDRATRFRMRSMRVMHCEQGSRANIRSAFFFPGEPCVRRRLHAGKLAEWKGMERMQGFIDMVARVNDAVNGFVWGIPMLLLLIGTGIYFTIRTKFLQVTKARLVSRQTVGAIFRKKSTRTSDDKRAISQFQALTTALAATIGTGNIAGVATAITIGGAGAVFWMWFSAFFGMMTNYAENVLGIYYRKRNEKGEWSGGAMYYISEGFLNRKGLRVIAKPLAAIFAVFCVLASFGIGNMTQINSIAASMQSSFHIPPLVTGIVLAVVVGLVVIGGIQRIAQVAERIVPFMAIVYSLGALALIVMNITKVPAVFGEIFSGAFGVDAVAGGISGVLMKNAITQGFKRGVFSNEAGLGSSVMVHSASNVKEPVRQGMWGIFEVFFDTIIVCSLTAFAILTSGVVGSVDASGAPIKGVPLVSMAFAGGFHAVAGWFVTIAVLLFAFTTVLGWSFYGAKALEYLFGAKAVLVYKVVFVAFVVVGATMDLTLAWNISDTLNGLMAIPNLIGILALSGTVIAITKNYFARHSGETLSPMLSAFPDVQVVQERLSDD